MKHRILLIASAILVVGALVISSTRVFAANSKKKVTTQQNLKYFKRIVMSTPYDVHFVQGDKNVVKLVGPQAEVASVVLRVSGETLYIERATRRSRMFFTSSDDVDIYVTSPDLTQLEIKGSGDFEANRRVDTDQLTVSINGSGDIDFKDVICDKLEASISGSGDIDFGKVECLRASAGIHGSGDIKFKQLKANKMQFSIKGSGDVGANLNNAGDVNCEVFGSGTIKLAGVAKSLNKSIRGSGNVESGHLQLK
jgi:hypothetical protein